MTARSLQDADLSPTWAQLGPTWAHLGPTWLHLAPISGTKTSVLRGRGCIFQYFNDFRFNMRKMASRAPQEAQRRPQEGPRWPKKAPQGPQDGPRWLQARPKMAQDGARMAPRRVFSRSYVAFLFGLLQIPAQSSPRTPPGPPGTPPGTPQDPPGTLSCTKLPCF